MKKLTLVIIILLLLTTGLFSCSESKERAQLLQQAVLIMDEAPDSALVILDSLMSQEEQLDKKIDMRCRLHRMNALNKLDTLFHSTVEAQQLADYFDSHGTANEQMLAHYLLGRTYYDIGESPMALQCFQEAVSKADTVASDCDYRQLSRIYGQMGNLFWQQNLYQRALECTDIETRYAWEAKDTLGALLSIASKRHIFEQINMIDSAIVIGEHAAYLLNKYGYTHIAASILGGTVINLLEKKDYEKIKRYINLYEAKSGFFDADGNIEPGREIYYYAKGKYFLAINEYDSAQYYFRKELRDGKDFNNQNAASHGLALLFLQTHQPDSAAKYALYSYDMNDSCYSKSITDKVIEIHAIYDYTNSQKNAQKERERAALATRNLWISICIMIIILTITMNVIIYIKGEKNKQEKKYLKSVNDLVKTQMELTRTRSNETAYKEIIDNMESKVEKLTAEIKEYNTNHESRERTSHEKLMNSIEYKNLEKFIIKGMSLTDEQIEICHKLTIEYFPHFYEFISSQRFSLNKNEFNACILIRLYVKPNSICHLLNISPSYVSKMRSEMLYKLFSVVGKPKEFDERLLSIR